MSRTFLGKIIPTHATPRVQRRAKPAWFALLVLPVMAAGGLLTLQSSQLSPESGPRTTGGALSRSIAAGEEAAEKTRVLRAEGGAAVNNPCTKEAVSKAFKRQSDGTYAKDIVLFPIIPDGIRGVKEDGTTDIETVCSQGFWTRDVLYWFGYKILAILNWFATALAILLTMYAGILYISGFANEGNLKTAKGILIGTFMGLGLVFLAKVIVYSAVNVVSNEDPLKIGLPVEVKG